MIYVKYEAVPLPGHAKADEVGGAFVACFINTVSKKQAKERALRHLAEEGWSVVGLEEGPFASERSKLRGHDDWLMWFDEAAEHGECYVFFEWPVDEEDA